MGNGKASRAAILVALMVLGVIVGRLSLPLWAAALEALRYPPWRRGYGGSPSNSIVNNLRILEGAKDQWALENQKHAGDRATLVELAPYLKGGTLIPVAGETYFSHAVGASATARLAVALGTYKAGSVITAP